MGDGAAKGGGGGWEENNGGGAVRRRRRRRRRRQPATTPADAPPASAEPAPRDPPPGQHPAQARWPVIRDCIEREGIARQHIDSYDWFVEHGMQAVVDEMGRIDIDHPTDGRYGIRLGMVEVLEPRMAELDRSVSAITPREARLRGATYRAPVRLEISVEGHDGAYGPWKKMHIGDIPVMVRSGPCALHGMNQAELIDAGEDPDDPGGYFVVNGSERIVVAQEDLSHNRILVEHDPGAGGGGGTTAPPARPRYIARIYSASVGYRTRAEVVLHGDSPVVVRTGASPVDLPAIIVMRAYGMEADRTIADAITTDEDALDALEYSFDQAAKNGGTVRTAREYIADRAAPGMSPERRDRSVSFILDTALLPHVGRRPENRLEKAALIGEAVSRILEGRNGWAGQDDRDHYGNKTVRFAGDLLADVFRTAFRAQARDMAAKLSRPLSRRTFGAIGAATNTNMLTDRMGAAISTGRWGHGRSGVSQALDRLNHLSTISHLRRIASPLSKSGENILARDVHSSYFGRLCPCETPEGAGCGLIKSLALEAVVSREVPLQEVTDAVRRTGVGIADPVRAARGARRTGTRVFCDGRIIGLAADGDKLASRLREQRRTGRLHPHVGIAMQHRTSDRAAPRLYLSRNAGRLLRPLLILDGGGRGGSNRPVMTDGDLAAIEQRQRPWSSLLSSGALELVDAHEEDGLYVAVDETSGLDGRTHMEVYPPAMLSAIASVIPYPEHNQSPRNTYESAMAKQSLGFSTPTVRTSTAARQHMMVYPQAPIVRTRPMELIGIEDRPAGVNCVVAVLPFDGYNIEDSVVLSKQSVERGLARSIFYRTYAASARMYDGGLRDAFERPDPAMPPRGYSGERHYRRLDRTGTAVVGERVGHGDMVIGMTGPPKFMADRQQAAATASAAGEGRGAARPGLHPAHRRDKSVMTRPGESGVVDAVMLSQAADGTVLHRVRVAEMRSPEIGDKFAARHGQKGVCGILARGEDLPYSADGTVPDLIINPHAFPSRMTIGMFVEMIGGKAAAVRGKKFDASAFVGEKVGHARAALEAAGYSYTGRQQMYDGRTGLPFKCETFVGVAFYQRLQHMAADKIHGRSRGPRQMLTGQPTHGKARGGGLRFGEMERDCMVAYGASAMLRDRMVDSSDRTEVRVCERCGQIAYYDAADGREKCGVCGDRARVSRARMGRAFKLLVQEVQALGIAPRLRLRLGGQEGRGMRPPCPNTAGRAAAASGGGGGNAEPAQIRPEQLPAW